MNKVPTPYPIDDGVVVGPVFVSKFCGIFMMWREQDVTTPDFAVVRCSVNVQVITIAMCTFGLGWQA